MKNERDKTLIIASHNKGKITEIHRLLGAFFAEIKSADELGLPEPEESGVTFSENALIKARAAMLATGYTAIADDSGLVIPALNGEPGVYSARWAGSTKDFSTAIALIEKKLLAISASDFSAKFICALAVCFPNGEEKIAEGEVTGTLVFPACGKNGFGYDPIFVADGMTKTFGEISFELKEKINHRAAAFDKLAKYLKYRVC